MHFHLAKTYRQGHALIIYFLSIWSCPKFQGAVILFLENQTNKQTKKLCVCVQKEKQTDMKRQRQFLPCAGHFLLVIKHGRKQIPCFHGVYVLNKF